jgi:hypothetical protein
MIRECNTCKQKKDLNDFPKCPASSLGRTRKCKVCTSVYDKQKYEKNKERHNKLSREYARKNREKINARNRELYREKNPPKKKQSPELKKLINNQRSRMSHALARTSTKKQAGTTCYIGCTYEQLYIWIGLHLTDGMTWDNYGEWEVDHILPISSFNLEIESERYKAFNWKNCRPLWKKENNQKRGKVDLTICRY